MALPLLAMLPMIGNVLDKVLPDKKAREQAKLQLLELQQTGELQQMQAASNVVIAEIQGESWLQRNWRPMLMVVIGLIVANNYILFPYGQLFFPESVAVLELPAEMWNLLTVGVGGYIVGRSTEKVAKSWKNGNG